MPTPTSEAPPRWWRPAAWLYIFGPQPEPGRPALGTVAHIEAPWAPPKGWDERNYIKLRNGSKVQVDPVIAGWLHSATATGWWGATDKALIGPFGTPMDAQIAVETAVANGGLLPDKPGEVAHDAHV